MPRYPPSRSSSLPSSQQQFPLGIRCPNPWQLYHPNIVPLFYGALQPIRFNDSLCHSAVISTRFRRGSSYGGCCPLLLSSLVSLSSSCTWYSDGAARGACSSSPSPCCTAVAVAIAVVDAVVVVAALYDDC